MTDRIRSAVEQTLVGAFPDATITRWEGPKEREWSWHWHLHASGPSGGDLILKVPRWEEAPTLDDALAAGEQDSTHAEIDGLRRIEMAVLSAGDPGLTAVEPLAYVAAVNGILMRRLEGESLRDRLGHGRGDGDTPALFDRLGRWIAVFHAIDGDREVERFDAGQSLERSRTLERRLRRAGPAPRGLLPAMALLRLTAERLDGSAEARAEIHGDLNLSNVLVGRDDRIAVIDPNRETGPALLDPVRVITDARLERGQLMTGGVARPAAVMEVWERKLLTSSGLADEPLAAYRLAEAAVERWVELELEVSGPGRAGLIIGRPLLRRMARRRLDALA